MKLRFSICNVDSSGLYFSSVGVVCALMVPRPSRSTLRLFGRVCENPSPNRLPLVRISRTRMRARLIARSVGISPLFTMAARAISGAVRRFFEALMMLRTLASFRIVPSGRGIASGRSSTFRDARSQSQVPLALRPSDTRWGPNCYDHYGDNNLFKWHFTEARSP
jgi:hypothetical protein